LSESDRKAGSANMAGKVHMVHRMHRPIR